MLRTSNRPADFPTMSEAQKADKVQLAWWYRNLTPTQDLNKDQLKVVETIEKRLRSLGGIDSSGMLAEDLSKKIGY